MKKNENIDKAIDALKNKLIPAGPPKEVIDATLKKLSEIDNGFETAVPKRIKIIERIKAMKSFTKFAIAAMIIIVVLIAVGVFTSPDKEGYEKIAKQQQDMPNIKNSIETAKNTKSNLDFEPESAAEKLEAELKTIEQMFDSVDVEGLTAMLSKGQYESKIAAANFIAKIGDIKALVALEELSKNWQGNEASNPFAKAIAEIKSRIENQKAAPTISTKEQIKLQKSEFTAIGILGGIVTNAKTGEPISDVEISLQGPGYERTKTDANGTYHFDKIREGKYRIEIKSKECVGITNYQKLPIVSLYGDSKLVKHFELEPACMIDIEVVNEANEPIKNVTVVVSSMTEEYGSQIGQSQRTDKNGVTTLGGIEPAEIEYLITAKQNGHIDYAPAGLLVKLNDTNTVEFGKIVMKKGVAVKGYAEYLDGIPAGNLQISAKPDWWHCNYSAPSYEIDPNGYFTLSHIEAGRYSIGAHIPEGDGGGYRIQTALQTNLPLQNDELLMVTVPQKSPESLVAISGTITYTCTSEERLDGIHISAYSRTNGHHSTYFNRYDNDLSTFTIDKLEPGTYTLTFSGSNIENKTIENAKAPSNDIEVELSYQIKPELVGIVLNAGTDEPVKQFKARIKLQESRYWQNRMWREFLTSDGKFNIEAPRHGVYQVQVIAEGFAPGLSEEVNTEKIEPVVIELTAGGKIKGKVVNEAGELISGAKVIPFSKAGETSRGMTPMFISEEGAVKTVNGEFVLKHLPEGNETIKVVHPGYSAAIVNDIEVIEGKTTEGIKAILTKGGTVEGFVYDIEGKPQANVLLFFQEYNMYGGNQQAERLASVITDSNGFYKVKGLPEKMCYVRRSNQWSSLGVVRRTFFPTNNKTVKINLGGKPKISGQITIDSQPLSNTKVLMSDVHNPHFGGFMCYAMTEVDGEFIFRGPPSGTWAIYYEAPNKQNKLTKVATVDVDAKDIDLGTISPAPIEEKLLIELKTSDPNGPLDNLQIIIQKGKKITGQHVGIATPVEGKKGLYSVQNLLPGKYTATIYRMKHLVMIREMFEIKESGEKIVITLQLPKGSATLTGVIKSKSPVPLVMVSANEKIMVTLQPAEDGGYKIEHIPAGEYSIGRWSWSGKDVEVKLPIKITLAEGENKKFDIDASNWDVAQQSFLSIQVVSENGLLLTKAEAWLEGSIDDIEPMHKSNQGQMFVAEPGEYTLHTTCDGYEEDVRNVSLEPMDMKNPRQLPPMIIKLEKK